MTCLYMQVSINVLLTKEDYSNKPETREIFAHANGHLTFKHLLSWSILTKESGVAVS